MLICKIHASPTAPSLTGRQLSCSVDMLAAFKVHKQRIQKHHQAHAAGEDVPRSGFSQPAWHALCRLVPFGVCAVQEVIEPLAACKWTDEPLTHGSEATGLRCLGGLDPARLFGYSVRIVTDLQSAIPCLTSGKNPSHI